MKSKPVFSNEIWFLSLHQFVNLTSWHVSAPTVCQINYEFCVFVTLLIALLGQKNHRDEFASITIWAVQALFMIGIVR